MFCIWAIMATLAGPIREIEPFLGGDDVVAVEVGGALLELREVLDGSQRALGAVDQLIEHPAAGSPSRIGSAPPARRMSGVWWKAALVWPLRVTVETRDAEALDVGLAVVGLVELLLGERREQQAHAFHLDRRQDAVQDREVSS